MFTMFRTVRGKIQIHVSLPRELLMTIHHCFVCSFTQRILTGHLLCTRHWWGCWLHYNGHSRVLRKWMLSSVTLQCAGAQVLHQQAWSTLAPGTTLGPITLFLSGKASGKVTPVLCHRLTACLRLSPSALTGRFRGGYSGSPGF